MGLENIDSTTTETAQQEDPIQPDKRAAASRWPGANYIKKHWKGQLPLGVSFWVNYFGLYVFFIVFAKLLTGRRSYLSPIQAARFGLLLLVMVAITYPWRIVGMWRCCTNYAATHHASVRVILIRFIIIVGVLLTACIHITYWPLYKQRFVHSFFKDYMAQYTLTLQEDNTLLHLEGSMGFGLSRDVKKILAENPKIEGIILDTPGGRAYEGRQLAKLVQQHGLDTYSKVGCCSAGTIPFLAGNKRYLASGCPLVFHRGKKFEYVDKRFDAEKIQRKDFQIYPSKEIERAFFDKAISELKANEYWIPTTQELLDARVVHEIILDDQDIAASKRLYRLLERLTKLEIERGMEEVTFDLESLEDKFRKGLTYDERDKIHDQLDISIEKLEAQLASDADPNDL